MKRYIYQNLHYLISVSIDQVERETRAQFHTITQQYTQQVKRNFTQHKTQKVKRYIPQSTQNHTTIHTKGETAISHNITHMITSTIHIKGKPPYHTTVNTKGKT